MIRKQQTHHEQRYELEQVNGGHESLPPALAGLAVLVDALPTPFKERDCETDHIEYSCSSSLVRGAVAKGESPLPLC